MTNRRVVCDERTTPADVRLTLIDDGDPTFAEERLPSGDPIWVMHDGDGNELQASDFEDQVESARVYHSGNRDIYRCGGVELQVLQHGTEGLSDVYWTWSLVQQVDDQEGGVCLLPNRPQSSHYQTYEDCERVGLQHLIQFARSRRLPID